jgi:hypothetical protein
VLYLLYVVHYSVNVPHADDWDMISLVVLALHGHLTMSALWSQYVAGRPFVARLLVVTFGLIDHLNERAVIVFSAGLFVASFLLLLVLFRSYLGKQLRFLSVLSLGIVWFSVADPWNALWAVVVYLVVFFFTAMAYLLLVPRRGRNLLFALAIVAAVAASLSYLQGFVVWPLGLICLVWRSPWRRRTSCESVIWIAAAVITMALYFRGYAFADSTCLSEGGQSGACSFTFGLSHPFTLARYLVVLVGNVVPSSVSTIEPRYLGAYEVLGTAICVVAAFVVVQSIRERRLWTNPLPLLLIAFAVLYDLMIALSHLGEGLRSAGDNRFVLPNFLLLAGVLVYAWAHVPHVHTPGERIEWGTRIRVVGLAILSAFVVAQCVVTTQFGLTYGRALHSANVTTARVVVNFDRIPSARRGCYFQSTVVGPPLVDLEIWRTQAVQNDLSVFQPDTERVFESLGPPVIAQCDQSLHVTTDSLPVGRVGSPYSATLSATGGKAPYLWAVAGGRGLLPKGLTLDRSSGVISGTPRAAGISYFSVTVVEYGPGRATRRSHPTYPYSLGIAIA